MSEKSKNILLGVLIVGLVAMTVAYAALSTTLTISGTANVAAAKWDVHFENWTEAKPANGVTGVTNTASTTTNGTMTPANKGTLINGLVISLPQPGDTMVYTFDIVNDGTINAKIATEGFSKTISAVVAGTETSAETSDLIYTVVCGDQASKPASGAQTLTNEAVPAAGNTLTAGYSRACKLTITYKEATNDNSGTAGQAQTYIGEARTVTLGANWTWVQD